MFKVKLNQKSFASCSIVVQPVKKQGVKVAKKKETIVKGAEDSSSSHAKVVTTKNTEYTLKHEKILPLNIEKYQDNEVIKMQKEEGSLRCHMETKILIKFGDNNIKNFDTQ